MKKQINADKASTLLDVSYKMHNGAFLGRLGGHAFGRGPVQLGVNWAACGTKTAYEARLFAMDIARLAHICEQINARELEAVLTDDRLFASHDEYRQACEQLATWLEEGNAEAIIEWLEA